MGRDARASVTVLLTVVGGLVALVAILVLWLLYRAYAGGKRAYARLAARLGPVADDIAAGRAPSQAELMAVAADRQTRKVLYEVLEQHGKTQLFPSEFLTWEAMAEAHLVAWLNHPNELGSPPDEIELMDKVPTPRGDGHYFVFRYRMATPHWAAKDGWMAGVVGPCDLVHPPIPYARGTFSRFERYDSRTPEDHVEFTHRAVIERRDRPR